MPDKEAAFYEKLENDRVKCHLCPHHCRIKAGQAGLCRVRRNQEGMLITANYGEIVSLALDPVEKKPLYHFCPGTMILSAGSFGCNLACAFCQNHLLAQETPLTRPVNANTLVKAAQMSREEGSIGLAFTYNEPSIWFEYIVEAAAGLKSQGLKVVLVTNGFIEKRPLEQLLPLVDAMNIDVKAFSQEFYQKNCRGKLEPVIKTVERAVEATHVEITTLIIPGENDNMGEIKELAMWLASLDAGIPWHLSRYHPAYRFTLPPTPEETLEKARDVAREYLHFVYLGNVGQTNNTNCLQCGLPLIERSNYRVEPVYYKGGRCTNCGSVIDYIKE